MSHIGTVGAAVAFGEFVVVFAGFDADTSFFDGKELARAFKVRLASQSAAGLQRELVELDILLQIERRERSDLALFVATIDLGTVAGADDLDFRCAGLCALDQLLQGEPKSPCDAEGDRKRGIRLLTLDFTEHAATHAAGGSKFLQRSAFGGNRICVVLLTHSEQEPHLIYSGAHEGLVRGAH